MLRLWPTLYFQVVRNGFSKPTGCIGRCSSDNVKILSVDYFYNIPYLYLLNSNINYLLQLMNYNKLFKSYIII
jgi:hypothetical protein